MVLAAGRGLPDSGNWGGTRKAADPRRPAAGIRASTQNPYFLAWYNRSPDSVFVDSILRPCFLAAVERKPRIECFCQSVAFTISARLAPLGRPISSRISAPLLSARGALASLAWAGLAAFLPALASFFREALALPLAAYLESMLGSLRRADGAALIGCDDSRGQGSGTNRAAGAIDIPPTNRSRRTRGVTKGPMSISSASYSRSMPSRCHKSGCRCSGR